MKSNEFRIGNFVQITNKIVKPEFVGKPHKVEIQDFQFLDGGLYEPIPLTPEVLEKSGWQVVDQGKGAYMWNEKQCWFHIYVSVEDGKVHANFNGNVVYVGFVHQLQNLYFALTGQELTIKL